VVHITSEHPFFTIEQGFVAAGNLKLGMHVLLADGSVGVITGWKIVPGTKVMYNLEVRITSSRWGWADFFLLADSPSVHDDVLITAFGETLRFFWSLRLQTLFPDRKFVVEVDEGIEGERGLAITFYQVDV